MADHRTLLHQTADLAAEFLDGLPTRRVGASATHDELLEAFGGLLPNRGEASGEVIDHLARIADPGLIASAGPRYFGFVIGGSLPAALAADWLTSAWDNNAGLYAIGPAASVAEEVAAGWLVDVFGLPADSSVGFSTGATMASFTALAAGRHRHLVDDDVLRLLPEPAHQIAERLLDVLQRALRDEDVHAAGVGRVAREVERRLAPLARPLRPRRDDRRHVGHRPAARHHGEVLPVRVELEPAVSPEVEDV